jgi:hypothetical protein
MSVVPELEYYANSGADSSPCRDLPALLLKAAKEIRRLEQQVQDLQKPPRTTPPQPDTLSPLSQTPHWQDPKLYAEWLTALTYGEGEATCTAWPEPGYRLGQDRCDD